MLQIALAAREMSLEAAFQIERGEIYSGFRNNVRLKTFFRADVEKFSVSAFRFDCVNERERGINVTACAAARYYQFHDLLLPHFLSFEL